MTRPRTYSSFTRAELQDLLIAADRREDLLREEPLSLGRQLDERDALIRQQALNLYSTQSALNRMRRATAPVQKVFA